MIRTDEPNADRQRRLLAVFEETMLQEPDARETYVDRACGDDPDLLADVMRLLAVAPGHTARFSTIRRICCDRRSRRGTFPRNETAFASMRRLGAGGMGVVYEVHDRVRDEIVALKTSRCGPVPPTSTG